MNGKTGHMVSAQQRKSVAILTLSMIGILGGRSVQAGIVVGSFDSTRSSRPLSGSDYSNLTSRLTNPTYFGAGGIDSNTVTLSTPVSTVTAATLAGDSVFFLTEVSSLAPAEATALKNFVLAGNELVLVTDSLAATTDGVTVTLNALDGGSAVGSGGATGATNGVIVGSGLSTSGPFGTLPINSTFGTTPDSPITPGSASTVIGINSGSNYLVEIAPDALASGSGGVLAVGDVAFENFFVPPATLLPNENNAILIENFISHAGTSVPEPASLTTLAAGGLLLGRRRRQG